MTSPSSPAYPTVRAGRWRSFWIAGLGVVLGVAITFAAMALQADSMSFLPSNVTVVALGVVGVALIRSGGWGSALGIGLLVGSPVLYSLMCVIGFFLYRGGDVAM